MEPIELKKLEELFYNEINKVEKEYHLYFGLRSIQKQLDHTESIYDHFNLDGENMDLCFNEKSDLPQEIRDVIMNTYQQVFLEMKLV